MGEAIITDFVEHEVIDKSENKLMHRKGKI
jgi:hypothetical protein